MGSSYLPQCFASPLTSFDGLPTLPADEWVADYYDYEPGRPGKGTFRNPKLCKGVKPEEPPSLLKRSTRGLRMRSLVPTVAYGE